MFLKKNYYSNYLHIITKVTFFQKLLNWCIVQIIVAGITVVIGENLVYNAI